MPIKLIDSQLVFLLAAYLNVSFCVKRSFNFYDSYSYVHTLLLSSQVSVDNKSEQFHLILVRIINDFSIYIFIFYSFIAQRMGVQ